MTVTATTELEAVNLMLSAIGETSVNTLDEDTVDDAMMALTTLRQTSKDFQAEGWHFNTDHNYLLHPNNDGEIEVPVTAAHVDTMPIENIDVVERGRKLWNRDDHTFIFTRSLKCEIRWMLDFEDLVQTARSYIAMMAANKFAKDVMGDEATVKYTEQELARARANFVADDMRKADHNMLTGSSTVNRAVRRRSPWVG